MQHLLSADLTLLKKMERESLLVIIFHEFWREGTSLGGGGYYSILYTVK